MLNSQVDIQIQNAKLRAEQFSKSLQQAREKEAAALRGITHLYKY